MRVATRASRIVVYVAGALSTALLCALIFGASTFRPVHDDYRFSADGVRLGAFGGAWDYFLRLNGGLSQSVYDYGFGSLVGSLPWAWAYLPFTASFIALVTLVSWSIIGLIAPRLPRAPRLALAPIITAMIFFSFGSLRGAEGQDVLYAQFAWFAGANRGFFTWMLLGFLVLWLRRGAVFSGRWWPLSFFVGLVLGLWNMPEALIVAGLCAVGLIARCIFGLPWVGRAPELLTIALGATAGGAINYFSPGSAHRKLLLPDRSLRESLREIPAVGEALWGSTFGSGGLLLVIIVALGAGILLGIGWGRSGSVDTPYRGTHPLGRFLIVLVLLLALEFVAVTLAASFAYFDTYHGWGIRHLLAVTVFAAVGSAGALIGARSTKPAIWCAAGIAFLVLAFLAEGQIFRLLMSISEWRRDLWSTGAPAGFGFIHDRDPGTWVEEDWQLLREVRERAGLD